MSYGDRWKELRYAFLVTMFNPSNTLRLSCAVTRNPKSTNVNAVAALEALLVSGRIVARSC